MQKRFFIIAHLFMLLGMSFACDKSGGGQDTSDAPVPKPSSLNPGLSTGSANPLEEPSEGPSASAPSQPPFSPLPSPLPSAGSGTGANTAADKFAKALKGLWALAIAQKPRACSTIYDFRDVRTLHIHLLCPGDKGRTIDLQSESFTRVSDDGQTSLLRRVSSTCGISPTTAGSVFMSYNFDPEGNIVLSEGAKTSPALSPLAEANYAADLRFASVLHGRTLVRGCFRSGNLANFEASGGGA